ncbi:MAG: LamG-like jellyroll fold domain-containing protein, partial [Rhodospirillales bacterium]
SFTLTATGASGTVDTETINVTINANALQTSPVSNTGVLVLDGTNDYVTVADNAALDIADAFTLEAWINLSDPSSLQNIIDKSGGGNVNYRLFVEDGHIGVFSQDSATVKTADGIVQAGEWTHVSASFDGSNVTFYVNGERVSDPQAFSTDGINAGALTIGRDDLGRYVDGMIDDVRIWSDARTADEIRDNYDQQVASNADNLAGNWIFDGANGTTVEDRTANNNDGTLSNGASVQSLPQHAVTMDGNGDHISLGAIGNLATGTGSFTHEIRFKTAGNSGTREDLISIGNTTDTDQSMTLYIDSDGQLKYGQDFNAGSIFSSNIVVTDNDWHHAAITYNSSTGLKTIYLDGIAVATSTVTGPNLINGVAHIGNAVQTGYSFNGQLADARFWNVARTADQIADHHDTTLTGTQTGLLASYPLDEPAGTTTVNDATGAHDGTLVGNAGFVEILPEIHTTSVTVLENHTASGTMTANDVVPTNAAFGVNSSNAHSGTTSLTLAGKGTVAIDAATGNWTFSPVDNFNGTAQFYLTASGGGLTDAEQITVTVQPVDVTSNQVSSPYMQFDGVDDSLHSTVSGMQTGTGSFSIETWFKTTDQSGILVDLGDNVANGALRLFLASGVLSVAEPGVVITQATGITVTDNTWHHAAVTYNGDTDTLSLYVDGALISRTGNVTLNIPTGEITLADYNDNAGASTPYSGQMADVRFWSTERTAAEIRDNHDTRIASNATDLQAQFTDTNQPTTNGPTASSSGGPDLYSLSVTIDEDQTASGTMTASDVVGTAGYSITAAATNGTVSINVTTGAWTYTPNANYSGADSFQLQATDGTFTDQETISVTVTADHDPNIAHAVLQLSGGTNDYASVAHDNALNATASGFTVEFWMNGSGGGANAGILDKMNQPTGSIYNGWKLNIDGFNNSAAFYLGDNDAFATAGHTASVVDGAWHHVAAVYDGTANTITMYVDGVAGTPVSTAGLTAAEFATTVDLLIGDDSYSTNPNYKGMLDDIRIWSDARTAQEISSNMNTLLSGSESNLVAYYTMDSPDGTTLTDKAGNNNPATLQTSSGINIIDLPTSAIALDGTGDYVSTPLSVVNNMTTGTIETWVYFDSVANETIFTKQHDAVDTYAVFSVGHTSDSGGGLVDSTDGKVYFRGLNAGGTLESTSTLQTGQWYHLAITFTGSEAQLYINGALDKTQSGNFAIPDDTAGGSANDARIGSWKGQSTDMDGNVA